MTYLPDELLFQITGYLVGTAEEKTILANLCRTSRSLQAFAQPFLYRRFDKPHKDLISEQTPTSRLLTRLEVFIRTLIQRPDLAALVETLTFAEFQDDDMSLDSDSDDEGSLPFDPTLADLFEDAARNVPEEEGDTLWQTSWRAELRTGNTDAEVALLLTLVPNLRSLDITSSVESLGAYVEDLCRQFLGPQTKQTTYRHQYYKDFLSQRETPLPFFSKLGTLTVRGTEAFTGPVDAMVDDDGNENDDERTFRLIRCVNLMTLPTIKSFTAYRIGEEDSCYSSDLDSFRVPLSQILHLKFDDCVIHSEVYKTFLNSCHELQSLEISFGCSDIDLSEDFFEVLKEISGTLERLILVIPRRHKDMTYATPFDIHKLHKLKHLGIECELLDLDYEAENNTLIHEMLPASLESLSILRCHTLIKPHIETLIENLGTFPDFKVLELDIVRGDTVHLQEEEEEELREFLGDSKTRLEETGIQLSFQLTEERE